MKTIKYFLITVLLALLLSYALFRFLEEKQPPVVLKPMTSVDKIVVEKSKRTMTVYHQHEVLRTYKVALGFSPIGHKEQEGDGKTPEGSYRIVAKNPNSQFHLSLKISYPSKQDKKHAQKMRFKPGGDIFIHGLSDAWHWLGERHAMRDWTLGCIAVTNEQIEEIYPYIDIGTVVEIKP